MWNTLLSWDRPAFRPLEQLQQDLDSLFADAGFNDIRQAPRGTFPRINISETEDEVQVFVFAPGVDAKAIDTTVQNNVLSIHGRREAQPADEDGSTYHRKERFIGEFTRAVTLPETVDPTAIEAQLSNGVLTITAPKRAKEQPRQIQVQTGK